MNATAASKSWTGPALQFSIIKECSQSRCRTAKLILPHHTLETPTFMPVGTKGTMKGLLPEQVEAAGADIILGNTYHLGTRPGKDILEEAGGLHQWMGWQRGLLTDSGGFQMVSLLQLSKMTEEGVTFKSPYDGRECVLTPEESISIQNAIGADIMMQLDDVVDVNETSYERFEEAVHRTTRWLDRCRAAHRYPHRQNLFPIVQGGLHSALRELSLTQLLEREAPGYAVGGLSGGEDKSQFWPVVLQCTARLPLARPRYCMGVGFAPDLVVCTAMGVDMFDCVYPTRTARFGCALTDAGQVSLKAERFAEVFTPVDDCCECSTCKNYTCAYLHAAFASKAPVACHLLSVHNIAYQMRLMRRIRESVRAGRFPAFVQEFLQEFYGSDPVPEWVQDALAAVNITLHESDPCVPFSGATASTADTPAPSLDTLSGRKEDHQDDYLAEDQTLTPTEEQMSSALSGLRLTSSPAVVSDNRQGGEDVLDEFDQGADEGVAALSGFKARAYDHGYRESLRQDYPLEEEAGRVAGFDQAFQMPYLSRGKLFDNIHVSCDTVSTDCEASGVFEGAEHKVGRQPGTTSAVGSAASSYNATYALSFLEGNLSVMLLRRQSTMTLEDIKEIASIRDSISIELKRANTEYKVPLEAALAQRLHETAATVLRSEQIEASNSCQINESGKCQDTQGECSTGSKSNRSIDHNDHCQVKESVGGVCQCKNSKDCSCDGIEPSASAMVRALYTRAGLVCRALGWPLPVVL